MEEIKNAARAAIVEFIQSQKGVEDAQKALTEAKSRSRKAAIEAAKTVDRSKFSFAFLGADGAYRHFSATRGGTYALKKFLSTWSTDGRIVIDLTDVL